jgi:hypothetical protein
MIPSRSRLSRRCLIAGALLLRANEGEPEEILRRAVVFDEANHLALRDYVWNSEEVSFRGAKEIRQQKYEVNLISGSMYWRKLEQMRRPLEGVDAQAETNRLRRHLESARQEANAPGDNGWRFERAFLEEIPRLHRVERWTSSPWSGTPCHRARLVPKKGARSNHPFASFIASFRIEVWIDKDSLHWIHSEWEAVRKVSWRLRQLPLGRLSMVYSNGIVYQGELSKGGRFEWTLERIPRGPWVLAWYRTFAGNFRNELRYFNFRRFTAESELLP